MKIRFVFLYCSLLLLFPNEVNAQISIKNIKCIYITDQVNWNFEKFFTYDFEIRFNNMLELWRTNKVSKIEFMMQTNKALNDSISNKMPADIRQGKYNARDEILKRDSIIDKTYKTYCDTVKPLFVKYIKEKEVEKLLLSIQEKTISLKTFNLNYKLKKGFNYEFDTEMSSYNPSVEVIVVLKSGKRISVNSATQCDLILPWTLSNRKEKTYNPHINWALYKIIPKEMNMNRDRLINGLTENE